MGHETVFILDKDFFPNRALHGSPAASAAGTMNPERSGVPRTYCGSSKINSLCASKTVNSERKESVTCVQ
jgi:hypothetical protein